jgi:signal transduction histidine kinase
VAVAIATLLVAAIVAPLRRRLQTLVNRRFHRRTFDAIHAVDDYVRRLRDEQVSLSELQPMLSRAVGDPTLEVGLWQADVSAYLRTDGTPLAAVDPSRSLFHVTREGAKVAVLVHDPALDSEPLLLDAVTRAAALPLDNARLQAEVLVRLEEVRASRQRIVTAAYEERRRIERDLHDGAQQRLVSLALSLRLAREHLDGEAAELLNQAAEELSDAVREVRELARGIHPASLTEDGLAAALEVLADRTPLAVVVDVPEHELPQDVAAAAYFTACEAVTNAVKHAGAKHVAIRAELRDGVLTLEVTDDGDGGATPRAGGGLQGLADRVDALGGRVDVTSTLGTGTVVRAVLPCVP